LSTEPDAEIARLFERCGLDADAAAPGAVDISRMRRHADARAYGELLKPLSAMLDSGLSDSEPGLVA
jgi:hypothetical protein